MQTARAMWCHANMKYTALRIWAFGIPREELHFGEQSTFSSIYCSHLSKTMGTAIEYVLTANLCLLWVY